MACTCRCTSAAGTAASLLAWALSKASGFLRAWFRSDACARARATTRALCSHRLASSACKGCKSRPVGAASMACTSTSAPALPGLRMVASKASRRRSGARPTRTCSQHSATASKTSAAPASARVWSMRCRLAQVAVAGPYTVRRTGWGGSPTDTSTVRASKGSCIGPRALCKGMESDTGRASVGRLSMSHSERDRSTCSFSVARQYQPE